MRKFLSPIIILCLWLSASLRAFAQIPYYAGTVGDGKLYGYTSLKARPGINHQETYTTFQYGLGDHFATGIDLYTGPDCAYWGALVRYGVKPSKWFNVGAEVISSFNLNDSFKFSYLTSGLYLNGAITGDEHLFWCTNTWWVVNDGADDASEKRPVPHPHDRCRPLLAAESGSGTCCRTLLHLQELEHLTMGSRFPP